jgi:hypothetical protein
MDRSRLAKEIHGHRRFQGLRLLHLASAATFLVACAGSLGAQQCGDNEADVAALLQQASTVCDEKLIYSLGAIAQEQASPELRKVLAARSKSRCSASAGIAADTALAKLGDANAFRKIETSLNFRQLAVVGDDRAITILMTFLVTHEFDKSRIRDAGDYKYDPLTDVIDTVFDISSRRTIPSLPPRWPAQFRSWEQYLGAWRNWWERHKDGPISTAPYTNVSDPYLRCLARRVDWGFADAILEIADRPGKSGLDLLRRFPRPTAAEPWGTIPGNLDVALAKQGDREALDRIIDELNHGASLDALRKLVYVGGADSASALVDLLGVPTRDLENAKTRRDTCVTTFSGPEWKDKKQRDFNLTRCADSYETAMKDYQAHTQSLLGALAQMVKNPPLPASALPTAENFQKWREWWAKNKDTAQFVTPPVHTYE